MDSCKRILITGIAGFIGSHLAKALLKRNDFVVGIDNFNSYYNPDLKKLRVASIPNVIQGEIQNTSLIKMLLDKHKITHVVQLAAQAGVRYSLTHPDSYRTSNLDGFFSILEALRERPHISLTFASSSSVYGLNEKIPFSEKDPTDRPANVYAATKKANEALAFSYHHLYGIPMTALRFFTVYGPYGRPDMAVLKFANAIDLGQPIGLYNEGLMQRDFTYIDDIVDGTIRAIDFNTTFEIFNIGRGRPEQLIDMVCYLEEALGKKALIEKLPMQAAEIISTYADIDKARQVLGFNPKTSLKEGIGHTIKWYKEFSLSPFCENCVIK